MNVYQSQKINTLKIILMHYYMLYAEFINQEPYMYINIYVCMCVHARVCVCVCVCVWKWFVYNNYTLFRITLIPF